MSLSPLLVQGFVHIGSLLLLFVIPAVYDGPKARAGRAAVSTYALVNSVVAVAGLVCAGVIAAREHTFDPLTLAAHVLAPVLFGLLLLACPSREPIPAATPSKN